MDTGGPILFRTPKYGDGAARGGEPDRVTRIVRYPRNEIGLLNLLISAFLGSYNPRPIQEPHLSAGSLISLAVLTRPGNEGLQCREPLGSDGNKF